MMIFHNIVKILIKITKIPMFKMISILELNSNLIKIKDKIIMLTILITIIIIIQELIIVFKND